MSAHADFWVRLWGVRGTVACPGPDTLRYGGNTACVEVGCGGHRLIFDAGTGLRVLGNRIIQETTEFSANLFFTHTHIDHISGLPFFRPAYSAGNAFEFWSGHLTAQRRTLQGVLCDLMQPPFFPVPLDIMHACVSFNDFEAGTTLTPYPDVTLRTRPLNHPGGATGYRIEYGGRSICYVTDTEHRPGQRDEAVLGLIDGADIVIYDATYTDDEFTRYVGWGHSTWQEGVRLCREAGAARLVTFHHDPDHNDGFLDSVQARLEEELPGSLVGREGLLLEP